MKKLTTLSALLIGALMACGGGGSNPPPTPKATSLVYTDPTGNFKLVKNASLSSGAHLVLDLVGPSSNNGNGVTAFLSVDSTKATWAKVASSDAQLVQNGTVFALGSAPQIIKAKVSGNDLQVGVSEKGNATGKALGGVLARVALDLQPGLDVGTGIALSSDAAKCLVLQPSGSTPTTAAIAISVGTLTAQ